MPDDLTAIEKRPGSWRLNYPDFGAVYRGPFAKGIITDFQKVSDVPLVVKSMVKVKGDAWGESEYIPLFYHPKPQYWDDSEGSDPLIKATDFNQEGKYYERAWMSFRGGDEVKVLLQEGVPKVVLGFFDNVPRIGETIFVHNTQEFYYLYNDAQGNDPIHWVQVDIPATRTIASVFDVEYMAAYISDGATGPDGLSLGLKRYDEIDGAIKSVGIISDDYRYTGVYQMYLREYYYVIGPIIFFNKQLSTSGYENAGAEDMYKYSVTFGVDRVYAGIFTENLYNEIIAKKGVAIAAQPDGWILNAGEPPPPEIEYGTVLPDEMILQSNGFGGGHPLQKPYWELRPHTKAELQAAGLWPWSN